MRRAEPSGAQAEAAAARRPRLAAGALALLGLAGVVAAGVRGELTFHLFVIFPVVTGTGPFAAAGVVLLMAAAVAAFASAARRVPDAPPGEPAARHGGVVLLGPIPFVWGSDRGMARGLLVLAVVLAVIVLVIMMLAR